MEILGYCGVHGGAIKPVRAADDWGWIVAARNRGSAYVLSCSDRFAHPPEYYPVEIARAEDLEARLAQEQSKSMTAVLAVWDLARFDPEGALYAVQ